MAGKGFRINKRGIDQITKDLQREFDKRPVRVPLQADQPDTSAVGGGTTTNYFGPVIHGSADGAQLAWNNEHVTQTSEQGQHIADGFDELARAVAAILARLEQIDLPEGEARLANDAGNETLVRLTESEPDVSQLRRSVATLKGVLATLGLAAQTGAAAGTAEWAHQAVAQLGNLI